MTELMKPEESLITIGDNVAKIRQFLMDVVLVPRLKLFKWSKITNQTPHLKIGYSGQHLASLVTGVAGTATGARGEDIRDGTEVKSCSRVDQMDTCRDCGAHVMRIQQVCPKCHSKNVERKNDSKWLFAIRSKSELEMYLRAIPRTLLLISDYPNFEAGDFSVLRFATYEIWNRTPRAKNFRKLLEDYYRNIYLKHIKANPKKTPAPKNFWPYSYQFYLCNPIKTFECIVSNADIKPELDITHYVPPNADRSMLRSEPLPVSLLDEDERRLVKRHGVDPDSCIEIDEPIKQYLPLRDTSDAKPQKGRYVRRHDA